MDLNVEEFFCRILLMFGSSLQGYPQALLPLTVAGIPSMHICLDFIPELLAQPQLEKQVDCHIYPFFVPFVQPFLCDLN